MDEDGITKYDFKGEETKKWRNLLCWMGEEGEGKDIFLGHQWKHIQTTLCENVWSDRREDRKI